MPRLFKVTAWIAVVVFLLSCSESEISPNLPNFEEHCLLTQRTFFYSSTDLSGTTTFEYDKRGNLVNSNSQNSLNEVSIAKYTNIYNAANQLEKLEKHSNGILESTVYYTYHENGKTKSTENHLIKANHITLTEYDSDERLIKTTRSQPNGVSKDEYTYNGTGQLAYFHSTINGKPYLERRYDYTREGFKTQYAQLVFDSQRKSVVQWEYDDHHKLIAQKWHSGAAQDLALTVIKHHHYDGDKRIASLKVWNDIEHKEHYKYSYDDQEQLTLVERSVDGINFFTEKAMSYHPNGQEKEVRTYKPTNHTSSYLELSQTYDEKGNLLSRTKNNPDGSVDWKWTYSYACQQIEVL